MSDTADSEWLDPKSLQLEGPIVLTWWVEANRKLATLGDQVCIYRRATGLGGKRVEMVEKVRKVSNDPRLAPANAEVR